MIPAHAIRPPAPVRLQGHFMLLRADGLRLLLAQDEVQGATCRGDAGPAGEAADAAPLALSERLTWLPELPPERYVVTRHATPEGDVLLAWNEVIPMIDACLDVHELPPAMVGPGSPSDGYVELPEGPVLCAGIERVIAHACGAFDAEPDRAVLP